MVGVLLINLGTPDAPTTSAVRRYLAEFLWDHRVLSMHPVARALLLYGAILPFRPRRSAAAYRQIWTDEGSPLLLHSEALAEALQAELGQGWVVELGMRYGKPDLGSALDRLLSQSLSRMIIVPLYPQYASSSWGSSVERVMQLLSTRMVVPPVSVVPPFYSEPGFIDAVAEIARPRLDAFKADHVLFSFHGLPESHVRATDPSGSHCLSGPDCCDRVGPVNRWCYRAHCYQTARQLASQLGLAADSWTVGFQSRLTREPWLRPYSDHLVKERCGDARRLAVMAPSFVADCLETLEEIEIRTREDFIAAGGEDFLFVPCVNAEPCWTEALAALVRREVSGGPLGALS